MTYRELLHTLEELEEEQLDNKVLALFDDEYYPVEELEICNQKEDDRLDDGHPYLDMP